MNTVQSLQPVTDTRLSNVDADEMTGAHLDQVSGGGRRAAEGEINYLNLVKEIYSVWSNLNIGGGRTMVA
jgi:hypothetical protein